MDIRSSLILMQNLLQKHDIDQDYNFLVDSLQSALQEDGFGLQSLTHRILKNHHHGFEKPGDPNFPYSVFLVLFCLVCAGLASGLTQVSDASLCLFILETSHP